MVILDFQSQGQASKAKGPEAKAKAKDSIAEAKDLTAEAKVKATASVLEDPWGQRLVLKDTSRAFLDSM